MGVYLSYEKPTYMGCLYVYMIFGDVSAPSASPKWVSMKCPLILFYQLGTHNIKNGFYIIFMPFWPLPPQLFTIDFWQWKAKNDNYMVCQKYLLLLLLNWLYCSIIIIENVDPWVHSGMMCCTQNSFLATCCHCQNDRRSRLCIKFATSY